jgi:hypothetical protein
MQSSYPIPGFHAVWRRRAYQFTVMRLVSPTSVALSPSIVQRALTTTALRRDDLVVQR